MKIDFNDTAAVKDFVLDLMIKNLDLYEQLQKEKNSKDFWVNEYGKVFGELEDLKKKMEKAQEPEYEGLTILTPAAQAAQ